MILRSGKVVIKKPKHALIGEQVKEDDTINRLADELLTKILSLLPDADAYRTRILSKKWKDLGRLLPNLHFVMSRGLKNDQLNNFHDFVDQTLALSGNMPVHRFYLECSYNKCDYNRVYEWICIVIGRQVKEIQLNLPNDRFMVRFCWDLFKTCHTLVTLTLKGEFVLDVPESELLFPCLKKISLLSIVYSGVQSLVNLISGSPVLQELCVKRYGYPAYDNLQTLIVSSPSLKRLSMTSNWWRGLLDHKVVIDAPKLEYLFISDNMVEHYSLTESLYLVEAHMSTDSLHVAQLVKCFTSAKILTLDYSTVRLLSIKYGLNIPMFPNMVKLTISNKNIWELLFVLLNNMPNLEHITFSDFSYGIRSFAASQNLQVDPPACLQYKMKEIVLLINRTIIAKEKQLEFIRFLLKNSKILVTLTIDAYYIGSEMREKLLNLYRGSNLCRIVFKAF